MDDVDKSQKQPSPTTKQTGYLKFFSFAHSLTVLAFSYVCVLFVLKVAHGILYETIRQLEDQGIHVPQSLRRSFVLLHSYILVSRKL